MKVEICYANSARAFAMSLSRIMATAFLLMQLSACASPEKRVALLIGNKDYQFARSLNFVDKDLENMVAALRSANFEIFPYRNRTLSEMREDLDKFLKDARFADAALFYFSGHGMQLKGKNYLLPTDANIDVPSDLLQQAVPLLEILQIPEEVAPNDTPSRINIVMLDACRSNQFTSDTPGLAEINFQDAETLVSFATSPGKIAEDADFYTAGFRSAVINHDGLRIQEIFDKVRQKVGARSGNEQIPTYYTNIGKDFYLTQKRHAKLIFTY